MWDWCEVALLASEDLGLGLQYLKLGFGVAVKATLVRETGVFFGKSLTFRLAGIPRTRHYFADLRNYNAIDERWRPFFLFRAYKWS